ncbi:hypothetical protein O181_020928 [Austropuccinia psidii MF-1]|uniref:Uncharacterized protein n=1 Tax=Austropuccinia psidii MF-1 TaxID=1389203 RepID=A0A9Q3CDW1_9BASI|nr:hypothetical protein [Austropuccinia psidii MF-1]
MISPVPSSIDLSTCLLGHHLMLTSLLNRRDVIIHPMKDGDGKRTFRLGLIETHGIQMLNTQWLEDVFCGMQQVIPFPILAFEVIKLTLPLFVQPFQYNNPPVHTPTPPIPGPSEVPASKEPPTENDSTNEPDTEVSPMQSTKVPFV